MTTPTPEPAPEADAYSAELVIIADGFVTHADGSTSQHPVEVQS